MSNVFLMTILTVIIEICHYNPFFQSKNFLIYSVLLFFIFFIFSFTFIHSFLFICFLSLFSSVSSSLPCFLVSLLPLFPVPYIFLLSYFFPFQIFILVFLSSFSLNFLFFSPFFLLFIPFLSILASFLLCLLPSMIPACLLVS